MKLAVLNEIIECLPEFHCCDCVYDENSVTHTCYNPCWRQVEVAEAIYELFMAKLNFADNIDELYLMLE